MLDGETLAGYFAAPATTPVVGARALRPAIKRSLPSKATLDYTIAAITALVLVLSLPWLLKRLVTNPAGVIAAAGRKQVK